jgi:hypothetical protein
MEGAFEELFYHIEPPLKVDCCCFASIFITTTSIIVVANFTITNVAQQ